MLQDIKDELSRDPDSVYPFLSMPSLNFNTLTSSSFVSSSDLHPGCMSSLTYRDSQNGWPLLPSIQSHPLVAASRLHGPTCRRENTTTENSIGDENIRKLSEAVMAESDLSGSTLSKRNSLQNSPFPENSSEVDARGNKSPTSVSERSINGKQEGINHGYNDIQDIDFDSVYMVLGDDVEGGHHLSSRIHCLGNNIEGITSWSEPNHDVSVNGYDQGSSTSSSSTSSSFIPKRVFPTDDDLILSSKRCRRISAIVPHPRKPRAAEYLCSKCNEPYHQIVEDNAWWAVYVQECPTCHAYQIPRIDINVETNAIETDPNMTALYGEGADDSEEEDDEDDGEFLSDEEESGIDYNTSDQTYPFDLPNCLSTSKAAQLLVLMTHARQCTGRHKSEKLTSICRSTKLLMLHIRDCHCINNECQVSWCHAVKKLVFHTTRCYENTTCSVCMPTSLPDHISSLHIMNHQRINGSYFQHAQTQALPSGLVDQICLPSMCNTYM